MSTTVILIYTVIALCCIGIAIRTATLGLQHGLLVMHDYSQFKKVYKTPCTKAKLVESILSERIRRRIISTLHKTGQALDKSGIRHWATAGTLLGYARDGALIPWDDDADLAVVDSDFSDKRKIRAFQEALREYNLFLFKSPTGIWKVNNVGRRVVGKQRYEHMTVDLFPYAQNKEDVWVCTLFACRICWPNEVFDNAELFPLQRAHLKSNAVSSKHISAVIWVPNDVDRPVKRFFGKSYARSAVVYSHTSNKHELSQLVDLNEDEVYDVVRKQIKDET